MIVEKHAAGRPAQFVLSTPDPAAVAAYYAAVLGWAQPRPGLFTLRGEPVARTEVGGYGWVPYFAVNEIEPVLVDVRSAGGAPGPVLAGAHGRTTLVIDPTAAPFGLLELGTGSGLRIWGEDGAVVWMEQKTRDQSRATAFLEQVFGFTFFGQTGPGKLRLVKAESPMWGGVMETDDRWTFDDPSHWLPYLRTGDLAAAVARGTEAGGSVWFPIFDTPLGPMAYLRDPAGNAFAVVAVSDGGQRMIDG